MHERDLKIGGVYRTDWDEKLFRVLGFDNIEVFYDCLWPQDNTWTFANNLKKKCYFYRTTSNLFQESSEWLKLLELNQAEWEVFRPDLPLRIGRTKTLQWTALPFDSFEHFVNESKGLASWDSERIECPAIVLIPYGPKGGLKRGTVVSSNNGKGFTTTELVWQANQIQCKTSLKASDGIGIYRIGFEKGLPSYCIGNYFDEAGLMKE